MKKNIYLMAALMLSVLAVPARAWTACGTTEPTDSVVEASADYEFAELDSMIDTWMHCGYYPGGSIRVVKDGQVVFSKSYGNTTADTKIYMASAGKWVAAAVIGAVVDHTRLDWDDTVADWLPEFKGDTKGSITLRRLLSHTSGVRP